MAHHATALDDLFPVDIDDGPGPSGRWVAWPGLTPRRLTDITAKSTRCLCAVRGRLVQPASRLPVRLDSCVRPGRHCSEHRGHPLQRRRQRGRAPLSKGPPRSAQRCVSTLARPVGSVRSELDAPPVATAGSGVWEAGGLPGRPRVFTVLTGAAGRVYVSLYRIFLRDPESPQPTAVAVRCNGHLGLTVPGQENTWTRSPCVPCRWRSAAPTLSSPAFAPMFPGAT